MKKLLVVLTLICSLCLPVFGGHQQMGGGAYCPCTPVEGTCQCCGASFLTVADDQENDSVSQHVSDGAELGVIRLAVLMWLKVRA